LLLVATTQERLVDCCLVIPLCAPINLIVTPPLGAKMAEAVVVQQQQWQWRHSGGGGSGGGGAAMAAQRWWRRRSDCIRSSQKYNHC
jgi:hypothetical protein